MRKSSVLQPSSSVDGFLSWREKSKLHLLGNVGGHDGNKDLDIVGGVVHGTGEGSDQVSRYASLPPAHTMKSLLKLIKIHFGSIDQFCKNFCKRHFKMNFSS